MVTILTKFIVLDFQSCGETVLMASTAVGKFKCQHYKWEKIFKIVGTLTF